MKPARQRGSRACRNAQIAFIGLHAVSRSPDRTTAVTTIQPTMSITEIDGETARDAGFDI